MARTTKPTRTASAANSRPARKRKTTAAPVTGTAAKATRSKRAPARRRPTEETDDVRELGAGADASAAAESAEVDSADLAIATSPPEVTFASRVPTPEPERPRPSRRRAVFFDVENTSRTSDVTRMLDQVAVDRDGETTELVASGNWRVIGNETARLLARHGAHLVHSAPATGVRDWSDLRIAVAAGAWLATARAGDRLDIVSDDKAFDVVGDVAATLGVSFVRHSYRAAAKAGRESVAAPIRPTTEAAPGRRRARGGRGTARPATRGTPQAAERAPAQRDQARPSAAPQAPARTAPQEVEVEVESAETGTDAAPETELLTIVREMLAESASGKVSLDAISNRLKARGFVRPPGSPRLVTRLRRFKELDVSDRGLVRTRGTGGADSVPVASAELESGSDDEGTASEGGEAPTAAAGAPRRRRRRGGGRNRGAGSAKAPTAPSSSGE